MSSLSVRSRSRNSINRRSFLAAASAAPLLPVGASLESLKAKLAALGPMPRSPNPFPATRYLALCIAPWYAGYKTPREWWRRPAFRWHAELDACFTGQCEFADRLEMFREIHRNNTAIIAAIRDGGDDADLSDFDGWLVGFELSAMAGPLNWLAKESGDHDDECENGCQRAIDGERIVVRQSAEFDARIVSPTVVERRAVEAAG